MCKHSTSFEPVTTMPRRQWSCCQFRNGLFDQSQEWGVASPRNHFEPKTPANSMSCWGLRFYTLFCPSKIKNLDRRFKSGVAIPQPSYGDDRSHRPIGSFLSESARHYPEDPELRGLKCKRAASSLIEQGTVLGDSVTCACRSFLSPNAVLVKTRCLGHGRQCCKPRSNIHSLSYSHQFSNVHSYDRTRSLCR